MNNRASVTIYHSCDAPAVKILHHFKKGIHKRPRSSSDLQPPPTERVNIPRRHGGFETVLRCPVPNCKDCATTAYEGNELTLTVAKSHNITGVNLRPSRTAKTAAERLQDGLERGKWIFSRDQASPMSSTSQAQPPPEDRTQRYATFHPHAASFARVLAFLRGVPSDVEVGDSTPPEENYFESSENGSVDSSGRPLVDAMPVGAYHGDFGARTASSRVDGNPFRQQRAAHPRSSREELKPGHKGGEGDIVFPRLMPTSLRGTAGPHHHRHNVQTWPAVDGTLERRTTTYAAPLPGGTFPLTQQPNRHHHHHHRTHATAVPRPFPPIPALGSPTTVTRTPSTHPTGGPQRLPPRPRDPNIIPPRPTIATPAAVGGAVGVGAEDLVYFANGLVADKRLLEDAGLVAQGRRKKVRV
ncbi:hypothetical protein NU219Hw_g6593t1 [Hortaea werneckii]